MSAFFRLSWLLDAKYALFGNFTDNGVAVDERIFMDGNAIDPSPNLCCRIDSPGVLPDFAFAGMMVPFATERAAAVIREFAADSVQFIPLNIPTVREKAYIVNVLTVRECIDYEGSIVDFGDQHSSEGLAQSRIRSVIKLKIDDRRTADAHLFRVKGFEIALIVSATLADEWRKRDLMIAPMMAV